MKNYTAQYKGNKVEISALFKYQAQVKAQEVLESKGIKARATDIDVKQIKK